MGAFGSVSKALFHERSADGRAGSFSAVFPVYMDIVQSEGIFFKNAQSACDDFSFFADESLYSIVLPSEVRLRLLFSPHSRCTVSPPARHSKTLVFPIRA